jgi:DUF1680 family protein
MELALYNAVLPGVALSGDAFFYTNPLAADGSHRRRPWIGLACCPTNVARILPQAGGLAYAVDEGRVVVNLFMNGEASVALSGGIKMRLAQETDYPWDGRVRLVVAPKPPAEFTLSLRIPGWARGKPVPGDLYRFAERELPPVGLTVNGVEADPVPHTDGYVDIRRFWSAGDVVELDLPMPVRRVQAHAGVQANRGKTALMRGPIVYCLEAADHPDADVLGLVLPPDAELRAEHLPELLGGVTVVQGDALAAGDRPVALTAVPYYAWANRAPGAMTVWIGA